MAVTIDVAERGDVAATELIAIGQACAEAAGGGADFHRLAGFGGAVGVQAQDEDRASIGAAVIIEGIGHGERGDTVDGAEGGG